MTSNNAKRGNHLRAYDLRVMCVAIYLLFVLITQIEAHSGCSLIEISNVCEFE